ncbi:MAG: PIG-L family deacetylase [Armatimonadetes bacterium]|nr:PIG-L family deacetylase [Armatimonadota bacterium]
MEYQRIMIFAAHADDEMTMSGTMAKAAAAGTRVVVVQMTDGCEGYPRAEMRDQIVAMRRQEAEAANQVLGVARRIFIEAPDMGLVDDKETLHKCIVAIRGERPEAIFTHGPVDGHRDHRNTHAISVDARWHAGEPVSATLGEPWRTPFLFYYKGVRDPLPTLIHDVTGYAHKRYEARATQVSQHTLFGSTREDMLAEARHIEAARPRSQETFWIAEANRWPGFPKGYRAS